MLVSMATIIVLLVSACIHLVFPFSIIVYFYKKKIVSLRIACVGAATFFLFSQVLEVLLHVYMFSINQETATMLKNPYFYAVYGALAAGIFEEAGRVIVLKKFYTEARIWSGGLSFGLGYGGFEMLIIGGLASLQLLIFSLMINQGILSQAGFPQDVMLQIQTSLSNTPWNTFALSVVERFVGVILQVALTFLVLYSVRKSEFKYWIYALLIHIGVDMLAGLLQAYSQNIWITEGFCILVGGGFFYGIMRARAFLIQAE